MTLLHQEETAQARAARGLDVGEWPSEVPVVFRCPTHGRRRWVDVTSAPPGVTVGPAPAEADAPADAAAPQGVLEW